MLYVIYKSYVISFNHVRENYSWVFSLNIARLGLNLKMSSAKLVFFSCHFSLVDVYAIFICFFLIIYVY